MSFLPKDYAYGKPGAIKGCWLEEGQSIYDPDFRYAERWKPTIDGQIVGFAETSWGFLTRSEAIASAKAFQLKCRELLEAPA